MANVNVSQKLSELKMDTNKQDGGLISKRPENRILFRKAGTQIVDVEFAMTNYGCFICQQNFAPFTDYDDHIESHDKDDYEIPATSWFKSSSPTFVISYDHCTDTNLLNFKMKSNKDIVIEKIVIVRQEFRKSLHCVDKSRITISKENRTYNFSTDCFLFVIGKEQTFFVIYRKNDDVSTRQIEKYVFFRKEQFPKHKISVISNSVPHHAQLVIKYKLGDHFPPSEVRSLWKTHYKEIDIMNTNTTMMEYLLERRLTETNYVKVLSFLLGMEDQSVLGNYEHLTLTNPAIQRHGCLDYSITFPKKFKNEKGKFLSDFDDVVVTTSVSESFYADDVLLNMNTKKAKRSVGYIYKVKNSTVFFSLRTKLNFRKCDKFQVKFYPHRIPLRSQYDAIKRMAKYNHILRVLFPSDDTTAQIESVVLTFFNKSVEKNPEQAQAVKNIVSNSTPSVPYILFGPPGTGKTTTIVESILQLWKTKPLSRILITSGSNAACDEVAKKICKVFEEINGEGLNLLRIYAVSYERRIDDADELLFEASNFAHGYHFYPSLESIYLFRIVVATLATCGKLVQGAISDTHFTHIFIDECAASTEPETLIGVVGLMGPNTKLILSGDPKQLGPVLKCKQAENLGLGISMMERLLNMKCYEVDPKTNNYDRSLQTILRRNYRSNVGILSISNQLCYNSQLIPCGNPGVTEWAKGWKNLPTKKCPILFHVVHGETVVEKGDFSSKNIAEIRVVMKYVREILKKGINGRRITQKEIGIISPYKKQYMLIRHALDSERFLNVETGSAENFQGQEKPIIIISTVKSWKNIGFLKNLKRLNVMLTRAQALMIIVGNPESLQKDDNWFQVLKYFQSKNAFIGKQFKLKNSSVPFNIDLLPNIPKNTNDIKDKQAICQQEKIMFKNNTNTYKQEETINTNASRFQLKLQNSSQCNNKTNCQQDTKCNVKDDLQEKEKTAKNRKKKKFSMPPWRKAQIYAEKRRQKRLEKSLLKGPLVQNSTESNVTDKNDCISNAKVLKNFHQEPTSNPIINTDKKNVPTPAAKVSSVFYNDINLQEEIPRSGVVEKTNTSRSPEKVIVHENLKNAQQNNSMVTSSNSNSGNQKIIEEPKLPNISTKTAVQMRSYFEDFCEKQSALSLENTIQKDPGQIPKEEVLVTSKTKKKNKPKAIRKAKKREKEQIEAFCTMASLLLEEFENSQQNNLTTKNSLSSTNCVQQISAEPQTYESGLRNNFGGEQFSAKDFVEKELALVHTTSLSSTSGNNKDANSLQQIKSIPIIGKNRRRRKRTRKEKQIVAFCTMASSLLEDLENSPQQSLTTYKSSTSNDTNQLVLKETHAGKNVSENKLALSRISLENTFKNHSVEVATATVHSMSYNSINNKGIDYQHKTMININQPKTNSTVGCSSDVNRPMKQDFLEVKVHGRHRNYQQDPLRNSEYPFIPTATVRPVFREMNTVEVPFNNRSQWNSYPSEEFCSNLYTRCPPLSGYVEPQVKKESNCAIL